MTSNYTIDFQSKNHISTAQVGGKGANLAELTHIDEIQVPSGFCVTTEAYKTITEDCVELSNLLNELTDLKADDREKISAISLNIRNLIENQPIPQAITDEIAARLSKFDEYTAFAVRSSATAEDLPSASFAGQQDTYLNIIGTASVLKHVGKCWASLFTDRAVTYRIQNGFDHHKVRLAVVVQRMVFSQASGIMFTADPVSGNRKVLSIDAGFGLGEALVSGLVSADNYKVRNGEIIGKKISAKKLAIYALDNGGTQEEELETDQQNTQALADQQILQLADIGRKIEAHFGSPQDIEWCLADNQFYIVQSRAITTLYPIPQLNDHENHVYISVGYQQMMTDAMKPLGLSIWQLTAGRPMYEAGGRLFVDVAADLTQPAKTDILLNVLGKSDPFIKDALLAILERDDIIKQSPDNQTDETAKAPTMPNYKALLDDDPSIVTELISQKEAAIKALRHNIQSLTGLEVFDLIEADIQERKQLLTDPRNFAAVMTAMNAATWINDNLKEWLDETNPADALAQSVANNITSEMGLELLNVADVIRPYPEVMEYLKQTKDANFLDQLPQLKGGQETQKAIQNYLDKYGMRCVGEIDITRTRWSENPAILIPLILNNIKNFEPGAAAQKFEQGRHEALRKEQELLDRLRQLPDGAQKAEETRKMISLLRNFAGYREYPKYNIVNRYFIYKQALLKEAEQLVQAGIIDEVTDIYYLRFEELREVVRTQKVDHELINRRKEEHALNEKLTPPRVFTGDGEIITRKYNCEDLPAGALAGIGVSSGIIEGRARVILNIEEADLEDGDILVPPFTDPSWTPLFVAIKGLVTEVGGLMTHGAVIAREYGLPAVVSVENATKLIKDGQRICINGTDGYIEIAGQ
ncbi:phosphoenolpyruvate synthase [Mucilaginibacter yixingensis]|nr:phosphoenolpyruvate synthase [Mucilaginibacter yixingensis]